MPIRPRLALAMLMLASLSGGIFQGCTDDETSPPATGIPDASLSNPDGAKADGAVSSETGTPDAEPPGDGSPGDSGDTDSSVADAESDAPLTGCDLGQACCAGDQCMNGFRCLGAACSCVRGLGGGRVIRTNGTTALPDGTWQITLLDAGGTDAAIPLAPVAQVMDGQYAGCARLDDGTVWCWVSNTGSSAMLGQGDSASYPQRKAVQVKMNPDAGAGTYLTDVIAISQGAACYGGDTVCAAKSDGSLWCWGYGDGNTLQGVTNANYPKRITIPNASDGGADGGAITPTQIVYGRRHGCFLASGDVYCWGANVYGSLGRGDPPPTPSLPLKVVGIPAGSVTKLTSGFEHNCALTNTGEIWCWGLNNYGQIGAGPQSFTGCSTYCEQFPKKVLVSAGVALTGVVDVQPTYHGTCATLAGGELYCWGDANGDSIYAIPRRAANDAGIFGVRDMTYCGSGTFGNLRAMLSDGGSLNTGPITCP